MHGRAAALARWSSHDDRHALCSQLDIAQPVFQHIVDEIVIGAQRADLVGLLTARFQRALAAGNPLSDLARSYCVIALRTLGSFLKKLSAPEPRESAEASRLGWEGHSPAASKYGDGAGRPAPAGYPGNVMDVQRRGDGPGPAPISQWPRFFRKMIDDNIVAADGLTAHSEADHELGEYLPMLTSNPLEVEL